MKKIALAAVAFFICSSAICQQADSSAKTEVTLDSKIFSKVEEEASFPGGSQSFGEFLGKHLKSNIPVKKKAPVGSYTVIVRFIVAKDGSVADIVAETNHGYGMEAEVIRVIKKSPDWKPAMQNGRPVNAYRRQPVTFVVQGK